MATSSEIPSTYCVEYTEKKADMSRFHIKIPQGMLTSYMKYSFFNTKEDADAFILKIKDEYDWVRYSG